MGGNALKHLGVGRATADEIDLKYQEVEFILHHVFRDVRYIARVPAYKTKSD